MTTTTAPVPTYVRVRLVNDEYMPDHGGRLRAGTAVEVDPVTAERWLRRGIAQPAEIGDLTLREQKRAEAQRLLAEAEELEQLAQAAPSPAAPVPTRGRQGS